MSVDKLGAPGPLQEEDNVRVIRTAPLDESYHVGWTALDPEGDKVRFSTTRIHIGMGDNGPLPPVREYVEFELSRERIKTLIGQIGENNPAPLLAKRREQLQRGLASLTP